jgi:DNA-binding XRE family transcriptional regulator
MPPTLYSAVKLTLKTKPSLPPKADKVELLRKTALLLNNYFQPFLAGNFSVDEGAIKGILKVQETPRIIQLIQLIDLEMDPVRFNYALGIGNIIGKPELDTYEENGPAWTKVNRALKEIVNSGGDVVVRLPSPFLTRTVNTLFAIESDLRNNWSSAHREAIKLVRHGHTQVEMAELLGVTQAAISQRLKHARWDRYLEVCATIDELLTQARWKMLLPWDLRKEQKKGSR